MLRLSLCLLSYVGPVQLLRYGTLNRGWGPPIANSNYENDSGDISVDQSSLGNSSTEIYLPR